MTVQNSYQIYRNTFYAGQLVDIHDFDAVSRAVETVTGADFGLAVSSGTNGEEQCVIGGTAFLGITIRDLAKEGAYQSGAIKYNEGETASVMRTGYIAVVCPSGAAYGDAVKYTDATGVIDSGAPAAGETAIANARWETVTVAGEVGIVRIGL